jgi:hypothetical protein
MNDTNLTWIVNFIWGIADDALRDVYVRGKYRDVILPMKVLRRLDAVLEPTISFTRYFFKPKPMRALSEIRANIVALEKETEGLLQRILDTSTGG